MSYVLLVIDMQTAFRAAKNKKTQKNCILEIKKAMDKEYPIVFLEYEECGKTLPTLLGVLTSSQYNKFYIVKKSSNDGSSKLLNFFKKKGLPRTDMRVCGVNTDCCVLETVEGLDAKLSKQFKIQVVEKACYSEYCHREGIEDMLSLSERVAIV